MSSSTQLHHGFVQFNKTKQIEILNICILAVCRKAEQKFVFTVPPS